jgi:hypothetical protein
MTGGLFQRMRLFGAACLMLFTAPAILPQQANGQTQTQPAAKGSEKQSGDTKPKADSQKPPAGGFASESEARSKCGSGVVWVGGDHFNHYPGSREYGKKPGYFACG